MKNKKLVIAVMIVLVVVLGVLGVLVMGSGDDTSTLENQGKTETIAVDTQYVDFEYVNEGKNVSIESTENEIEMFGKVDGKKERSLFKIVFGGDEGILLGTYGDDGIPVNLIITEFDPDDSWTEEEKSEIYSMQEEMNYFIDELKKDKNFEE